MRTAWTKRAGADLAIILMVLFGLAILAAGVFSIFGVVYTYAEDTPCLERPLIAEWIKNNPLGVPSFSLVVSVAIPSLSVAVTVYANRRRNVFGTFTRVIIVLVTLMCLAGLVAYLKGLHPA